jgi:curved DNA-binding protein CbpA
MSDPGVTYYEILGVRPSATYEEMEIAYQKILHDNSIEILGPFGRQYAQKAIKDANIAWAVLSDPTTRSAYNKKIGVRPEDGPQLKNDQPPKHDPRKPFNFFRKPSEHGKTNFSTSRSFFDQPAGAPREKAGTPGSTSDVDEDIADWADEGPSYVEAASRYMESDTGTVVDLVISKWRLKLNLSSKFRFLNDVSELSDPRENESVSFQIGLAYNTNSRETFETTINELTVYIEKLPEDIGGGKGGTWSIARLQTVFKESISHMPSLILTLTAESLPGPECHMPWEFGFDFDLNEGVKSHRRGTCIMFSREEYPDFIRDYVGAGSPEFELKKDKGVNANVWKNMASEKLLKIGYGNVTMWRLAAVGWKG